MNPYAPPGAATASVAALSGTAVPIAALEGRVFVRERTLFGRPGFVVDGVLRRAVRGVVEIPDATGRVHKLRLRGSPFDPCPRVEVDGVVVDVFPRLPGWLSAVCMLPLLLMLVGGAVGGATGAVATFANFRLVRSRLPLWATIPVCGGCTAAAYGVTVGVGVLLRSLLR